jgi:hypothetical protein
VLKPLGATEKAEKGSAINDFPFFTYHIERSPNNLERSLFNAVIIIFY